MNHAEIPHVTSLLRQLPHASALGLIERIENESRAALDGVFADADLTNDDHIVVLHLDRKCWPRSVVLHLEVLRACLAIREAGEPARVFYDLLIHALEALDPDRGLGAQRRANQRDVASRPRSKVTDEAIAAHLAAYKSKHGTERGWQTNASIDLALSASTLRARMKRIRR